MIDLLQITNDPAFARQCDAIAGMRLFVDLERLGKAQRQAGRNTFISGHQREDVAHVKKVLHRAQLMVRVNPWHDQSKEEVDAVLALGADMLMLPMFENAATLRDFCVHVAGRAPVVALVETRGALHTLHEWIATPGLYEIYVGLNDLHLSLGCCFMFEPLADGLLDGVAHAAQQNGLRFGFGGVARLHEGLLPGRDVLAEHLRLGSQAVILSRTFHRSAENQNPITGNLSEVTDSFEHQINALRQCESVLMQRSATQVAADKLRIAQKIHQIALQEKT